MDTGFNVSIVLILLSAFLSHKVTLTLNDVLVTNIPSNENFKLCESLDTELHSFDKLTATCENGFQFDLIKKGEQ
jgi:hypothetical protein